MRPHSTSKHDSPYIPYTQRLKQISPTPRQALKQSFNNTEIKQIKFETVEKQSPHPNKKYKQVKPKNLKNKFGINPTSFLPINTKNGDSS